MYNNNFKIWDTVRITKMWLRDMKWANAVGKIGPIDLFDTGLPETLICLKKKTEYLQSPIKWSVSVFLLPSQTGQAQMFPSSPSIMYHIPVFSANGSFGNK